MFYFCNLLSDVGSTLLHSEFIMSDEEKSQTNVKSPVTRDNIIPILERSPLLFPKCTISKKVMDFWNVIEEVCKEALITEIFL